MMNGSREFCFVCGNVLGLAGEHEAVARKEHGRSVPVKVCGPCMGRLEWKGVERVLVGGKWVAVRLKGGAREKCQRT